MSPTRRNSIRLRAFALLVGVCFAFFSFTSFFRVLESNAFVSMTRQWIPYRPGSNNIAIVYIDEKSIAHFGRERGWRWPWPRSAHADLITLLHVAGAREIWVDIVFSEPSFDAYEDDHLIAVSKAVGNVHFASKSSQLALNGLSQQFNVASHPEANGVACRDPQTGRLLVWNQNPATLELGASQLIEEGEALRKSASKKIEWTDSEQVSKALASMAPSPRMAALKDKIVFIGASAASTQDLQRLPLPGAIYRSGVLVHAMARSNVETKTFLTELPQWSVPLGCIFIPLLMSAGFLRLRLFAARMLLGIGITLGCGITSVILFHHLYWLPPVMLCVVSAFSFASLLGWSYWIEGAHKRRIVRMFGDFVSPDVVRDLIEQPDDIPLGGVERELTVFFSDLEGFTTLSEKLSPQQLLELLNFYLTEMSEQLIGSGGYLADYVGDGILGVFGAPLLTPDHAMNACRAALNASECIYKLQPEFEKRWGMRLRTRIGIHTGTMIVGQLGSPRKRKYGVVGDAVNFGSRLEGLNKFYGTSRLVSRSVVERAQGEFNFRAVDRIRVKGKSEPWDIFELLTSGKADDFISQKIQMTSSSLSYFQTGDFDNAKKAYEELAKHDPTDLVPHVFIKRIDQLRTSTPAASWDGIWGFSEK